MNVLLSCVGRQTLLIEAFREALGTSKGIVVAVDGDPLAPAPFRRRRIIRVAKDRPGKPLFMDP